MENLQSLDYAVVLIYLVLMGAIGVFFGWFVKDVSAYFKGGNTIPWPVAGISNFMSMFSTFVFVAYAGIAYEHGLVALTVIWCTVPPCILAATLLADRWRRAKLTTPVEYLETRFNIGVRQLFSGVGLLMRFLDNAVRLYAIGVFLEAVTPLSLSYAVVVSGLIITFYTVIGGLWAVTVLDTLQFVVLLLATAILLPLSLEAAGGFRGIADSAPDHLNWFNGPKGAPLWLMVYYVMLTLKYNANWAFVQRLYSVRDETAARKVAWLSAALFLIAPVLFILPTVAARVVIPDLPDKEMAYVAMSNRLLPAGMMGVMLAAMFSATMSSLNSEYNVMAGVLTNDLYHRLLAPKASKKHLVWVARVTTITVGLAIMVGALYVKGFGGAFEANKLFTSIFAIPLAVPLIFGLAFRRPSPIGAAATVLGGAACALALNLAGCLAWETNTLIVILTCSAIFLGSGAMPQGSKAYIQRVADFFSRLAKPLPEEEKPTVDPAFRIALMRLFLTSLLIIGALFVAVSLISLPRLSGILGVTAGAACCLVVAVLFAVSSSFEGERYD